MPRSEDKFRRRRRRTRGKLNRINRSLLPRLSVFRSNRQIAAQIIDDVNGVTLAAASSIDGELKSKLKNGSTSDAAVEVGKLLAKRAKSAKVEKVQFDRGGYLYHGRVKALADGAREGGLNF